jgi:hypothetical protein
VKGCRFTTHGRGPTRSRQACQGLVIAVEREDLEAHRSESPALRDEVVDGRRREVERRRVLEAIVRLQDRQGFVQLLTRARQVVVIERPLG